MDPLIVRQGLTYPQNAAPGNTPQVLLHCSRHFSNVLAKLLILLGSPIATKVGIPSGSQTDQRLSVAVGSLPTKLSTDPVESFKSSFKSWP
jgi:hypothetical protein